MGELCSCCNFSKFELGLVIFKMSDITVETCEIVEAEKPKSSQPPGRKSKKIKWKTAADFLAQEEEVPFDMGTETIEIVESEKPKSSQPAVRKKINWRAAAINMVIEEEFPVYFLHEERNGAKYYWLRQPTRMSAEDEYLLAKRIEKRKLELKKEAITFEQACMIAHRRWVMKQMSRHEFEVRDLVEKGIITFNLGPCAPEEHYFRRKLEFFPLY